MFENFKTFPNTSYFLYFSLTYPTWIGMQTCLFWVSDGNADLFELVCVCVRCLKKKVLVCYVGAYQCYIQVQEMFLLFK